MNKKENLIIKKQIKVLLKEFLDDDEYYPTFDFEDEIDMKPGGKAYSQFLSDLKKDKESFVNYKNPTNKEVEDIISRLKYANLNAPEDIQLINKAREMLGRELNSNEVDKIKKMKRKMEKMHGTASYN